MATHVVARASDLPPGERRIVVVGNRSIGIFNIDGKFYALRNSCPHQGAPLCLGSIHGTMADSKPGEYRWEREGQILRCPWHGWEFDITTGRSVFNPHKTRVRSFEVTIGSEPGPDADADTDGAVETYSLSLEEGLVLLHM